jgi:hypothetical protein
VVLVVQLPLWHCKVWREDLWWDAVLEEIWSWSVFPLDFLSLM